MGKFDFFTLISFINYFPSLQCQVENDIEYEFPCFNLLEEPPEMWSASDRRFDDPVYGGILLSINPSTGPRGPAAAADVGGLFRVMFPRLQSCLRRHANRKSEEQGYELYQWCGGSKLCCGAGGGGGHGGDEEDSSVMEAMITLREEEGQRRDCVEVKVRGGKEDAKKCFFFLEEILGVVDQVGNTMAHVLLWSGTSTIFFLFLK